MHRCGKAPQEYSRRFPQEAEKGTRTNMIRTAQAGTVRRVVSTRMPTRWGVFQTLGFERDISNGSRRVETALAIVLGDLTEGAPLLRIHSRCFTGEVLRSRIETRIDNKRIKYD